MQSGLVEQIDIDMENADTILRYWFGTENDDARVAEHGRRRRRVGLQRPPELPLGLGRTVEVEGDSQITVPVFASMALMKPSSPPTNIFPSP